MRLRILSINDLYELDHLPRLANLLRAHVLPAPDVTISIIAGDFVGPSLLSSLDAGRGMVDCLNALGIDYAILGNHEDDISPAELHARVAEFRGTWLSTNVDFDPKMPRDAIVRVGDHSVGLVGVVVDDLAVFRGAPFGGATLRPAQADALAAAVDLRARGCSTHASRYGERSRPRTHTYRVALVRNVFVGMDHNEPLMQLAHDRPVAIPPAGTGRHIKHLLAESFAVELWKKLGGFDQIDTTIV